ncbi:MAG: putative Ig domain-containing protein [Streptosporangiaceae bacterium]
MTTGAASASATAPHPHVSIAKERSHGAHASQPVRTKADSRFTHACAAVIVVGHKSCMLLKRDGLHSIRASASPNAIPAGVGYGPSQLQSAYNLTSASAADGAGRTIAVVDAFDDPTAAADLAAYRSAAGLPAVPSFEKLNQNGQTSPLPSEAPASDDWTLEESLDLDMASAICPLCNIVLVEATNDSGNGLDVAENAAANVAGYISNSWGGTETSSDTTLDSTDFNHPGDVITASAGDSDFGVIYPATSPNVVAVGGTRLSTASNSRGWTESVWNTSTGSEGTGSGCSSIEPQPSWQTALGLSGCSRRIDNDVSADADPATGVAVYDTSNGNGGWNEVGGTSASSPMLAAMYALAGNAGSTPADDIYTHTGDFFDVTTGNNGSCSPAYLCTAETGYDGPTGIGTPDGIAGLVTGGGGTGNTVTVTNPGNQTGTVGTAVSLQIHASDSASGQTLTYSATGLPAGLSISSSGLISGTPTTAATSSVTVTAKDTTGASGSASFSWTISSSGGGGTCSTHTQLLGNPGFETGSAAPWTSTAGVINPNGAGETSHSGNWYAWLDGYGTTHTDTLSQTVTIPAGCTATTFSFWLHIDTAETTRTTAFDKLTITANGTTIATFSNLNHNSGYTQHTYSLGSFAGSSVTVKFTGREDSSLQTSFVVDDTAISPN